MTFEEDFPSLKDKGHIVTKFIVGRQNKEEVFSKVGRIEIELARDLNYFEGVSANIVVDEKVFDLAIIQKLCLDKSKVQQVIEKLKKFSDEHPHEWFADSDGALGYEKGLNDLLHELRLEG